ncbi:peptidase M15 [Lutibacter profundi]|uniref:D-alanyl-D-alanine dipeptidase n=2 Tax=Lutibacter profundi TaxID=1622118 RepID=A0A109RPL7_9FLAO|nr:peptidase M15 [Lutibacter profundi]
MVNVLNKILKHTILCILLFVVGKGFAQQLPKGFVDIKTVIPAIELEIRYAGNHNFIGKPIDGYNVPKAIITVEAANMLKKIQLALKKQHLGLKIYDAYRPQKAVNHFVKWAKNLNDTLNKEEFYPNVKKKNLFKEEYIASRSGHSRGSTVDITIIDLSTDEKKALDMGSPYDFFGKESWVSNQNLTSKQLQNRKILQELMRKYNFKNYPKEWWHFTLRNEPYPDTYFNFSVE